MMQAQHQRKNGVMQKWKSMRKNEHETHVQMIEVAHGTIKLGKGVQEMQKSGRGVTGRRMRSKKSWHSISETLLEGKLSRER